MITLAIFKENITDKNSLLIGSLLHIPRLLTNLADAVESIFIVGGLQSGGQGLYYVI